MNAPGSIPGKPALAHGAEVQPALRTQGLRKNFRGLLAVGNVDFELAQGARHALIGPNGAGKTTLLNLISGHLRPSAGELFLNGRNVSKLPEFQRTRLGLARTFQINQLFRGLTVLENVLAAVSEHHGQSWNFWHPAGKKGALVDEVFALLDSVGLENDALKPVAELPYGRQRLVEIAIALGLRPKVLLLDEPTAGVPSSESHLVLDLIERLDASLSLLIIEHDMDIVFRLARRITVMANGSILTEGSPEEIAGDEAVRAVYLGEGNDAFGG